MNKNKKSKALGRKKYLAVAIPLLMAAQVQALEFNLGQIEGSFDSQLSMGSSWRVEGPSANLLTNGKGEYFSNGDDGDRNYQNGDAFSQIFKGSHDLQFSYQNLGGFVRGKYWYDSALDNNNVDYGHGPTTARGGVTGTQLTYDANEKLDDDNFNELSKASGATLLDAYVYGEFELFNMPLDVRLGKQVVSWGESTFIQGGVNAINPVDINAFTRPGAEIKEGLLPLNMAYVNIGLSDSLSAEAFYQLAFQESVLPGCGTYFSTNDYVADGCNSIAISDGIFSVARAEDGHQKARDDGQYGLALRYTAEYLGDTEFGFYAMNTHSRAPLVNGIYHSLSANDEALIGGGAAGNYVAAGGIPGFASPQEYAQFSVAAARAGGGGYYVSYPEDLKIMGLSFATNVGSVALSGELSHKLDAPLQINGSMLIQALVAGVEASSSNEIQGMTLTPGEVFEGYRKFDISQLQVTAVKTLDQVMGANRMVLVGEAAYNYIHSFEEGAGVIKYGRSDVFGTPGDEGNPDDGFVTASAWGYRARLIADYSDAFMGVNLQPMLVWSHDVKGYSAKNGSNFGEGQQSLGLSVEASYLETYSAAISYTQFMGGDFSEIQDRDYASISMGVQF